jgi:hypothetical protein
MALDCIPSMQSGYSRRSISERPGRPERSSVPIAQARCCARFCPERTNQVFAAHKRSAWGHPTEIRRPLVRELTVGNGRGASLDPFGPVKAWIVRWHRNLVVQGDRPQCDDRRFRARPRSSPTVGPTYRQGRACQARLRSEPASSRRSALMCSLRSPTKAGCEVATACSR